MSTATVKGPLYAVAFNERVKVAGHWRWIPAKIRYVHADCSATAKAAVIRSTQNRIDVIGVALAIGYFTNDSHGERLSTS